MSLRIRCRMNDWLSSNLSARKQCVVIDNISSEHKSIYRDNFCNKYINMSRSAPYLNFVHFADDMTVFSTSATFSSAVDKMNNGLKTIDEWLKTNRLSLNISKISYMIFSDLKHLPHKEIKIREEPISKVSEAKFLGIYIDENCRSNATLTISELNWLKPSAPFVEIHTWYLSLLELIYIIL